MATKKPVKKIVVKKVENVEKKVVNPWRGTLTPEKYHVMLLLELDARSRGKGEQIAPSLSEAEFSDYKKKYKDEKKCMDYLEAPVRTKSVTGVLERNASVKGRVKVF